MAIVKPGWAWPSRSETTLIGVPAATSSEAWVWRRSWNRIRGSPSRGDLAVEELGDRFGVDRVADGVGEDRVAGVGREPVASLALPPDVGGCVRCWGRGRCSVGWRRSWWGSRRRGRRRFDGCGRWRDGGWRAASRPNGARRARRGACRWSRRGEAPGGAEGESWRRGTGRAVHWSRSLGSAVTSSWVVVVGRRARRCGRRAGSGRRIAVPSGSRRGRRRRSWRRAGRRRRRRGRPGRCTGDRGVQLGALRAAGRRSTGAM